MLQSTRVADGMHRWMRKMPSNSPINLHVMWVSMWERANCFIARQDVIHPAYISDQIVFFDLDSDLWSHGSVLLNREVADGARNSWCLHLTTDGRMVIIRMWLAAGGGQIVCVAREITSPLSAHKSTILLRRQSTGHKCHSRTFHAQTHS